MADNTQAPTPWLTGFQLTEGQLDELLYWSRDLPFKENRKYLLQKVGDTINVKTNHEERETLISKTEINK